MLSQGYFHIADKIKEKYPDAIFYAVSRGRFRYISTEKWNKTFIWLEELAPSKELLDDYKKKRISWEEYIPKYFAEMDNPKSRVAISKIAHEAVVKPVILFCHCGPKEGNHCHRFLLMDLVNEAAQEAGTHIEVNYIP